MRAVSPEGKDIVGTLEKVYGVAMITEDSFGKVNDPETGLLAFEYGGWTDIDWNSQESVLQDGERVFVDTDGTEWPESQITLVDDDEVEDTGVNPEAGNPALYYPIL